MTDEPDVAGEFLGSACVSTGASNENIDSPVPTIDEMVKKLPMDAPYELWLAHFMNVLVFQFVVAHTV